MCIYALGNLCNNLIVLNVTLGWDDSTYPVNKIRHNVMVWCGCIIIYINNQYHSLLWNDNSASQSSCWASLVFSVGSLGKGGGSSSRHGCQIGHSGFTLMTLLVQNLMGGIRERETKITTQFVNSTKLRCASTLVGIPIEYWSYLLVQGRT